MLHHKFSKSSATPSISDKLRQPIPIRRPFSTVGANARSVYKRQKPDSFFISYPAKQTLVVCAIFPPSFTYYFIIVKIYAKSFLYNALPLLLLHCYIVQECLYFPADIICIQNIFASSSPMKIITSDPFYSCFIYIIYLYGKNATKKIVSILHFLWHFGISVVTGIYFGIQPSPEMESLRYSFPIYYLRLYGYTIPLPTNNPHIFRCDKLISTFCPSYFYICLFYLNNTVKRCSI